MTQKLGPLATALSHDCKGLPTPQMERGQTRETAHYVHTSDAPFLPHQTETSIFAVALTVRTRNQWRRHVRVFLCTCVHEHACMCVCVSVSYRKRPQADETKKKTLSTRVSYLGRTVSLLACVSNRRLTTQQAGRQAGRRTDNKKKRATLLVLI